jgi:hypothetical protein
MSALRFSNSYRESVSPSRCESRVLELNDRLLRLVAGIPASRDGEQRVGRRSNTGFAGGLSVLSKAAAHRAFEWARRTLPLGCFLMTTSTGA